MLRIVADNFLLSEKLSFIEEWKDKEAIERHNDSEHFTRLVPKMAMCS